LLVVFACVVTLGLASPGDAWAQRWGRNYSAYGPTYGYNVGPAQPFGYVRPGWGYGPYGNRFSPSYTTPGYINPGPGYYSGAYFNTPYYGGSSVYYYHW
jgi:hypothetical protein